MENLLSEKVCTNCQDFESNVGHEGIQCPNIICENCNKNGHIKVHCMLSLEDLPFPNEILLKIFICLDLKELVQCARVSKRIRDISMIVQKRKRR